MKKNQNKKNHVNHVNLMKIMVQTMKIMILIFALLLNLASAQNAVWCGLHTYSDGHLHEFGSATLTCDATINVASETGVAVWGGISGNYSLTKTGAGTFSMENVNGACSSTGLFTHSDGWVYLNTNWVGAYTKAAAATLRNGSNASISGTLTLQGGNLNFSSYGPGKLTVASNIIYSGTGTNTITVDNVTSAQTNRVLIQANSGGLDISKFTLAPIPAYPEANLSVSSDGKQLLFNTSSTTLQWCGLQTFDNDDYIDQDISLTCPTTLNVMGGANVLIWGAISGNHSLTKTGAGTLNIMNNANTANGTFTHSEGNVYFVHGGNWAGAYTKAAGATLLVVDNANISGTLTLQGGNLDFENDISDAKLTVGGNVITPSGITTIIVGGVDPAQTNRVLI